LRADLLTLFKLQIGKLLFAAS